MKEHKEISTLKIPQNFAQKSLGDKEISTYWWRDFHSPILNTLIDKALKRNYDILSASQRIEQAYLEVGIKDALDYPSVNLSSNSSLSHKNSTISSSSFGVGVSYEIDLWGKIKSSKKIANASLNISRYEFEALRLSLISTISSNYFNYLLLTQKLKLAQENLQIAQKIYAIINAKYKNGTLSSMELSRQKMVLLSQQSTILSLKTQKGEQLRALALLCGEVPQNFSIKEESIESIKTINLSTPLPSTLLLHRPDIASSFEQLKIAEASIDSANASKFPSFSLNANGGLASSTLLFLTNPTSSIGAILGIDYALFDGGKLDKEIKIEESKAKIAVQNYEKNLITALKEVEDGLSSVERERQEAILQKEMLKEAQKTFNLSSIRYKEGTIELQILLEAQKTFFEAKQNRATQKLAQLNALITLVKVLGGGWSRGY